MDIFNGAGEELEDDAWIQRKPMLLKKWTYSRLSLGLNGLGDDTMAAISDHVDVGCKASRA